MWKAEKFVNLKVHDLQSYNLLCSDNWGTNAKGFTFITVLGNFSNWWNISLSNLILFFCPLFAAFLKWKQNRNTLAIFSDSYNSFFPSVSGLRNSHHKIHTLLSCQFQICFQMRKVNNFLYCNCFVFFLIGQSILEMLWFVSFVCLSNTHTHTCTYTALTEKYEKQEVTNCAINVTYLISQEVLHRLKCPIWYLDFAYNHKLLIFLILYMSIVNTLRNGTQPEATRLIPEGFCLFK